MKRKAMALILCLALIVTATLPGTLAVSIDQGTIVGNFQAETPTTEATTEGTTEASTETTVPTGAPQETTLATEPGDTTGGDQDSTDATDAGETTPSTDPTEVTTEPTAPQCTCAREDGNHDEGCPLYEEVEVEEVPEGTPPESWGSSSLAGAVPFTNVAPLIQFDMPATLDLFGEKARATDNGVVLNKTAKANANGGFDITLEAYATGVQTTVGRYDPVDIVLVLDTSGSMREGMSMDDYEIRYIASNYRPAQYEKSYILQDGEFVVVMYTGYRWAILNGNAYGNTVVPKTSASDSAQSYMEIYDGIDTSKTYYVAFTQNGSLVYHAVTYRTRNGQTGWFREGNLDSSPRVPKTAPGSEGSTFYQYQESVPFYKVKDGQNKLDTLKSCVDTFIRNSLETSPESSIAIVPFGGDVGTVTDFTSNRDVLTQAVQNLTANGATNSGAAMQEAARRINSLDSSHSDHKKIVIMFTDGEPTTNNDFDATVADTAIRASYGLKQRFVTVYTIGVFAGANGNLESVSTSDVNKYMHLVSSNYPDAENWNVAGEPNDQLNGKSYYLSATNSSELSVIFQRIYEEVGGATNTTLGSSTVVKDIIAPSFAVPANASDVKLYTADCTGAGLTFGNRTPATGVTATITGDTLDVTGFDFSANWCGSHSGTYSGKKLIIEFTVSPKEGFLGGNDVPTNGDTSGLYSNGTPVGLFEVPNVNVPIQDVTVTAGDKNVYLLGNLTAEQIKAGATAQCGTVNLNLAAENYGLQPWQYAYVTITATYTDASGNTITNLSDLKDDTTYTVSVTVTPKTTNPTSTEGTVATTKTNSATGNINVFKPELTFKDSTVYYGDNAPTDFSGNKTAEVWKHDETLDTTVTMTGSKPDLALSYTPVTGVVDDKIATKDDIPVDVTVKIGTTDVTGHTGFVHTKCDTNETDPTDGKFWLHVKTCTLTITKAAGANTTIGDDEYFVFNIKKDGKLYTQVTIQGTGSVTISELPVGNYAVEEDASTAWRYAERSIDGSGNLTATNPTGEITCTNGNKTNQWLNFFNRVINVLGNANPTPDSQK